MSKLFGIVSGLALAAGLALASRVPASAKPPVAPPVAPADSDDDDGPAPQAVAEEPADPPADDPFEVFRELERIDSETVALRPERGAMRTMDSLRLDQLFDTEFTFPKEPARKERYAINSLSPSDTLWRRAFGNGLYQEDLIGGSAIVITGHFYHPARIVRPDMSQAQLIKALGWPAARREDYMRYNTEVRDFPGKKMPNEVLHQAYKFYFRGGRLFALDIEQVVSAEQPELVTRFQRRIRGEPPKPR